MSAREYVDNETLNVDPVELVCLLYAKAIEKLSLAQIQFGAGEIQESNQAVAFTMEIITELQGSLSEEGGDIASNLAQLYDYLQRRLTEGLVKRSTEPLDEVILLLGTLHEGWKEIRPVYEVVVPEALPELELAETAGRAWTL